MLINWLIFWGCVPSTNEQCFSLICLVADGADKPLLNCFDQSNPKKKTWFTVVGGWDEFWSKPVQTLVNVSEQWSQWSLQNLRDRKK